MVTVSALPASGTGWRGLSHRSEHAATCAASARHGETVRRAVAGRLRPWHASTLTRPGDRRDPAAGRVLQQGRHTFGDGLRQHVRAPIVRSPSIALVLWPCQGQSLYTIRVRSAPFGHHPPQPHGLILRPFLFAGSILASPSAAPFIILTSPSLEVEGELNNPEALCIDRAHLEGDAKQRAVLRIPPGVQPGVQPALCSSEEAAAPVMGALFSPAGLKPCVHESSPKARLPRL